MIHRSCQHGQRLDVAGLNEILVLVDRAETLLTEVGLNTWRKGLEGPPHHHEAKEQIFYVTAGAGLVVVGHARYPVKPGSLVYIPPRVVHQTIVTGQEPLSYLLFNAFLDAAKEGHASFADHIDQVKHLRKQQAQTQRADVAEAHSNALSDRPGKYIENVRPARSPAVGATATEWLLHRSDTERTEVACVVCLANTGGDEVTDAETERTLFVLEGRGQIAVGPERAELRAGDVAFVPWCASHRIGTTDSDLVYLCFRTWVADVAEGR